MKIKKNLDVGIVVYFSSGIFVMPLIFKGLQSNWFGLKTQDLLINESFTSVAIVLSIVCVPAFFLVGGLGFLASIIFGTKIPKKSSE
jgi:hypothetical protein